MSKGGPTETKRNIVKKSLAKKKGNGPANAPVTTLGGDSYRSKLKKNKNWNKLDQKSKNYYAERAAKLDAADLGGIPQKKKRR